MSYKKSSGGILVPGADTSYRADAWVNAASGMGYPGLDKTASTTYSPFGGGLGQYQLEAMYQHDWLARKLCTKLAEDATRKWLHIDGEDEKRLLGELERLKLRQCIRTATSWARLFGGAGIVLITAGDNPEEPLDPSRVRRVVALEVYDRYWLSPVEFETDVMSPDYQKPRLYELMTGQRFHASRVLKFYGMELTRNKTIDNGWWGGSVVDSAFQAIRDFQGTANDIRYIMSELNIGILKIPNLTAISAMGENSSPAGRVRSRVSAFNSTKSNYRVAAIDAQEDFQFVSRNITGVGDVIDRFMTTVAAASDGMTELVLFGKSPSGLNASQEEQLQVWYDRVDSHREDQMAPAIDTVLQCVTGGDAPQWEFEALYELSDEKKAAIMQTSAAALASIADIAGLSPSAVIAQLNTLEAWDLPEGDDSAPTLEGDDGEFI